MLAHLKTGRRLPAARRTDRGAPGSPASRGPRSVGAGSARTVGRRQRRHGPLRPSPPRTTRPLRCSTTARRVCSTSWRWCTTGISRSRRRSCRFAVPSPSMLVSPRHTTCSACASRERGENEEARQALTRALEIKSDVRGRARRVGRSLRGGGSPAGSASNNWKHWPRSSRRDPERLVNVGIAYAHWGRTDAAVLTLARAADRFPDEPSVRTALGRVWLAEAERDGDPVALEKALEALQPSASSAHRVGRDADTSGARASVVGAASPRRTNPRRGRQSALRRIPSHFVTLRMPQNGSGTPPSPGGASPLRGAHR